MESIKKILLPIIITISLLSITIASTCLISLPGVHVSMLDPLIMVTFIVCLSLNKKLFWFVLMPILLPFVIYYPIGKEYGVIDNEKVFAAYSTNPYEMSSFFETIQLKNVIIALLCLISIIIFRYIINNPSVRKDVVVKKFFFYTIPLLFTLALPGHLFFSSLASILETTASILQLEDIIKNPQNNWQIDRVDPQYDIYVLIMGESGHRDYHHVYGYPIKNTPFLDSVLGVFVNNFLSAATHTAQSVTGALIVNEKNKPNYALNVIGLANKAGFETFWISNQEPFSRFTSPITIITMDSQHTIFIKDELMRPTNDKDLLRFFNQFLEESLPNNKKKFFVIHLNDLHPYEICSPHLNPYHFISFTEKYDFINCYASVVYNTDSLLKEFYTSLKNTNKSFSLIYTSDHGVEPYCFFEKFRLKHSDYGDGYQIPLIKLSSDDKDRKFISLDNTALNFTNGIATWLGIETDNFHQKEPYNLFSENKNNPYRQVDLRHRKKVNQLERQKIIFDPDLVDRK